MSLISHNCKRERLFDYGKEVELDVILKQKDKAFSSCDEHIILVNFQRKSKSLHDFVQLFMKYHDLDALQEIKEMIIGDPNLADGLKPSFFERLVDILVAENNNESKGSAACLLGFAKSDECIVVIKEKATEVLVQLMSNDCDTISIPVLRTLTRLARLFPNYASYIVENRALEGAHAVNIHPLYLNVKIIQNLAKFLVVVVCRVKLSCPDKVHLVVTILDKILQIRESSLLRCSVRACYALSLIEVKSWVYEGKICQNLIEFIGKDWNDMVAYSALRVIANVVESGNSSQIEILTKKHKFLQCLGRSGICCRPKKFQKEACHIISYLAAKGGTSIKDMDKASLIDALVKLLEADDIDVKTEAGCTLQIVICGNS